MVVAMAMAIVSIHNLIASLYAAHIWIQLKMFKLIVKVYQMDVFRKSIVQIENLIEYKILIFWKKN